MKHLITILICAVLVLATACKSAQPAVTYSASEATKETVIVRTDTVREYVTDAKIVYVRDSVIVSQTDTLGIPTPVYRERLIYVNNDHTEAKETVKTDSITADEATTEHLEVVSEPPDDNSWGAWQWIAVGAFLAALLYVLIKHRKTIWTLVKKLKK